MGHTRECGVKNLNVLYTLDSGFKTQLVVSLNSLIRNTKKKLNVFIIFDNLDEETRSYFMSLGNSRVKIKFLDAPKISNKLIPDRGAISQFYRLYLTKIFKGSSDISKLLYLDCDTLIMNSSIENIANIEMDNDAIAATIDPWSYQYKSIFKLEKDTDMFNSGIFFINLEKWKEKNYDEKLEQLIKKRKHFIQADQGILNELIHGKFKVLDPKFNVISSYFEMNYEELMCYRKPVSFYSKDQIKNAVKNPCIVHFTSTFLGNRPWQNGSNHPLKKTWVKDTKFYHVEIKKEKNGRKKQTLKKLFNILPRDKSIYLFGLLQAYLRPIFLKIKLSLGGG